MKLRLSLLFLITLYFGCTDNPFFSDEIKTNERLSFTGNVQLPFTSNHSNILVYVEGLDVLTKTDRNGDFKIEMPVTPGFQPGQGLTAFYNVYYYVANYGIKYSTIFVNKGEFAYGLADLNNKGVIYKKIVLRQLLDVRTIINPAQIKKNHSEEMTITIRLENKVDSVIVFSRFTKENKLASAFLIDQDFPQDSIYLISHPSLKRSVTVDSLSFWTMDLDWSVDGNDVKAGFYDVIPYLYVYQPNIPDALLKKISPNVTLFTREFLKLPFRRQNGQLNIQENF